MSIEEKRNAVLKRMHPVRADLLDQYVAAVRADAEREILRLLRAMCAIDRIVIDAAGEGNRLANEVLHITDEFDWPDEWMEEATPLPQAAQNEITGVGDR